MSAAAKFGTEICWTCKRGEGSHCQHADSNSCKSLRDLRPESYLLLEKTAFGNRLQSQPDVLVARDTYYPNTWDESRNRIRYEHCAHRPNFQCMHSRLK